MSRTLSSAKLPELLVRSMLHKMGYRFRLHSSLLPGKPEIVLPKYKTVIFVHGCFWHRHHGCKYAYNPKSRQDFWAKKFQQNIERHRVVKTELETLSWHVVVIWECETFDPEHLRKLLDQRISAIA